LRQGLLQAGLAMMATTRGGPGSFLGAVGEGGMAGLGGYSKSLEETQKAQDRARKQAIEDEKIATERATSPLIRKPDGSVVPNPATLQLEEAKLKLADKYRPEKFLPSWSMP